MDNAEIIKSEASAFVKKDLLNYLLNNNHRGFVESIKSELLHFYNPEFKIIFLNELKKIIRDHLEESNWVIGMSSEGRKAIGDYADEKIIFYIDQEICYEK